MVEADQSRPGEEEPEKAERVERLVRRDEGFQPGSFLDLHARRSNRHVDEERDARRPGEKAEHDEQAAQELGPARERRIEGGRGDAPIRETLGHSCEVVDLSPTRLEEEVTDEQPHEELRNPLCAGQALQRIVDPCCPDHRASSARIQPSANQLEMARNAASTASERSANASQTTPSGSPDLASASACASSASSGACHTSKPFLPTALDSPRGDGDPAGAACSSACHSAPNSCSRRSTRSAGTKRKRSCGSSSRPNPRRDRKSTRLNSSHLVISYAVFCLKKKKKK